MQFTVKDIITHVLREINVIDYNETASGPNAYFVLSRLVLLADAWQADRMTIQATERKVFDLVANQASYTWGVGGNWNAYAPERVAAAGFINTFVNPTNPLETPVDIYPDEIWARIALKTLTSTIVWGIWIERTYSNTTSLRTVFVHPIITNIGKMALYYPIPWNNVTIDDAGLNTTLVLPPGYFQAIIDNLVVNSADAFEKIPTALQIEKAKNSLRVIKRSNVLPAIARLPKRLMRRVRRGYNILVNQ